MADVLYPQSAPYVAAATQAAAANGVPTQIFLGLVQKESSWNVAAVSSAGAYGLAQLMHGTAGDLGVNRYDTAQNLNGGAKYLKQMFDKFGNWYDALRAYNQGPNNSSLKADGGKEYATAILSTASALGYSDVANTAVGATTAAGSLTDPMTWLDRLIYGSAAAKANPSGQPGGASAGISQEDVNSSFLGKKVDEILAWLKDHLIAMGVALAAVGIILFSLWSLFSDPASDVKSIAKIGLPA